MIIPRSQALPPETLLTAKKSSDEKTLFWYHAGDAAAQLNSPAYTYYCEAIG